MDSTKDGDDAAVRKIHPVIAAMERTGEPASAIEGYLGSEVESSMRIYPALDTTNYVELPKTALVHLQGVDGDSSGRVRAFVPASSEVVAVHRWKSLASDLERSADGFNARRRPGTIFGHPFWGCATQCEGLFAGRVATIQQIELRAFREQRPEAREILNQLVAGMKPEAEGILHACLAECEAKHGPPPFMEGPGADGRVGPITEPYSRGGLHQRLVDKYGLYGRQ